MWGSDEGQAEYEANMQGLAEYEAEMEANAAYAAHEEEMENQRNKIISELEAEIQAHEHEIIKLQKSIEELSK